MNETDETEARLRATLEAKAGQLVVEHHPFDTTTVLIDAEAPTRSRRRLVAAAALVTIAAAATAVALANRPQHHGTIVATESSVPASTTPTSALPAAPNPISAPLLAPAWVPDGEKLWSLTSERRSDLDPTASQLFGTVAPDGTLSQGLLVELTPAQPGQSLGDSGTPVTVRGQSGRVSPSKDAGDAPSEIDWMEGGASVRATVRGPIDAAIAALDALQPRAGGLTNGFDPTSAPSGYGFLGEHLIGGSDSTVAATLEYSAADPTAGAKPDYTVSTFVSAAYPEYLRVWIAGHRAADGTAVEVDPDAGLFVAWPDGREVIVGSSAANPDSAVLEQIARSVATLDASAAAALAEQAQDRVALTLPSLADAPMKAGELSLYGTHSPTAVCLQLLAAQPACSNPFNVGADGATNNGALPGYEGSAVIDGHWYVFVAEPAEPAFSQNGSQSTALPAETAVIDGMHVALLSVPDDVDHVQLLVPTSPNQDVGGGFSRPGA